MNSIEKKMLKRQKKWDRKKPILEQKIKIKQEKIEILSRDKISTSKKIIAFILANCTIIEVFSLWATIKSIQIGLLDFSPLTALIGAIIGESITFAFYAIKSSKENSEGGIVYETAMRDYERNEREPINDMIENSMGE